VPQSRPVATVIVVAPARTGAVSLDCRDLLFPNIFTVPTVAKTLLPAEIVPPKVSVGSSIRPCSVILASWVKGEVSEPMKS
jgi:hypothetical protein